MNDEPLIISLVAAFVAVATYFLGLWHGQPPGTPRREFLSRFRAGFSRRGFVASISLSAAWVLLFYAFVLHTRLSLGRWPRFGEHLENAWLSFHGDLVFGVLRWLVISLVAVPLVALVSLVVPRWRPVSVYSLCYAAGIGLALASIPLAPGPFLNWFFD
jgi:hypothetical protein